MGERRRRRKRRRRTGDGSRRGGRELEAVFLVDELTTLGKDSQPGIALSLGVCLDEEYAVAYGDGHGKELGGGSGERGVFVKRDDALQGELLLVLVVSNAAEADDEPAALPVGAGLAAAFLGEPALVADGGEVEGVGELHGGGEGGPEKGLAVGEGLGGAGVLLGLDGEALLYGGEPVVAVGVVTGDDEVGAGVVAGEEEAVVLVVGDGGAVALVEHDVDGAFLLFLLRVRVVR